jgi:CPA2 family monovalent cation:H+ antiporter-2
MNRLLLDFLVVFSVAGAVVFLFNRLRIPAVVGLLVAGVALGPHGLRLVANEERVHVLAEVGVIVLLFSVGLEFSLSRVLTMGKLMLQIGLPQVLLSAAITVLATWWYFPTWQAGVFAGMLVAMSSTAIVFKILSDRAELSTPHGRIEVAVLLLQDLLVVVCMLVIPLLAPAATQPPSLWTLPLGMVAVAAILVAGKYLVPRLLYQIVRTRNRELFLLALVVICIGTATLTDSVGLSLALGAFLAGLTLAESEYGHQALAEVLPFRDTLSSLFFVSVGMLLDVEFLVDHLPLVAVALFALILTKFIVVAVPTILFGYPLRTAVLAGLALAQVGEFSFVLADTGFRKYKLLQVDEYQAFLAAAVLSMVATPFLMTLGPRLAEWLVSRPRFADWEARRTAKQDDEGEEKHDDHVVIAGYGFNGRNLASVLKDLDIPYVAMELNPETVRRERAEGMSILFGDCTRPAVLEHAGMAHARAYVVAISDPASTRQTVQLARQLNPAVRILVRARYRGEIEELRSLGADEIISEEFESSIEIFACVLRHYHVPGNVIAELVAKIREDHYEVFREELLGREHLARLAPHLAGMAETESCLIRLQSPAAGKSIGELQFRTRTGASVIAVRSGAELVTNPGPDRRFRENDVVVLLGTREQLLAGLALLDPPDAARRLEEESQPRNTVSG